MYDYDERPITRLPSTLLGISASVQDMLPSPLRALTIAKALSSTRRGSSPTMPAIPPAPTSIANLLSIPPMHVDVVAEAVVRAVGMPSYEGVLDTQAMAKMVLGRATGAPVAEEPQFV